jgi:hypothetical protein
LTPHFLRGFSTAVERHEELEVMARVLAMSKPEQSAAIGAGFAALREAVESGDEASRKFTFGALSAVLDGVAEARLEEIATLCRQTEPTGPKAPSPDQVANALAQAFADVDQQLGRAMLADTMTSQGKENPARSPEEDYLYRAWAVTSASCDEISRLLQEDGMGDKSLGVFLLVVKTYSGMVSKLPPGGLLPQFRLEKT